MMIIMIMTSKENREDLMQKEYVIEQKGKKEKRKKRRYACAYD